MTKSILVVDDEASICFALEHLMKSEGYAVATANNGKKAIDCAIEQHPDLILLDIGLPDRDGYDVCQALRAQPQSADIKIVMMSVRSREVEIEKGLAVGADAYLIKPFSLTKVIDTVHQMLTDTPARVDYA